MTHVIPSLASDFRYAMAHLCAPVSVITAMDGDRPHGTTVSAVMSLSVDPVLIAVALAENSDCLAYIGRSGTFGVNLLAADQEETALRFATKGPDKFTGVAWRVDHDAPCLDEHAVWLACTVAGLVPGGDHRIVLGQVEHVEVRGEAAPLTYHDRRFGTHVAQAQQ